MNNNYMHTESEESIRDVEYVTIDSLFSDWVHLTKPLSNALRNHFQYDFSTQNIDILLKGLDKIKIIYSFWEFLYKLSIGNDLEDDRTKDIFLQLMSEYGSRITKELGMYKAVLDSLTFATVKCIIDQDRTAEKWLVEKGFVYANTVDRAKFLNSPLMIIDKCKERIARFHNFFLDSLTLMLALIIMIPSLETAYTLYRSKDNRYNDEKLIESNMSILNMLTMISAAHNVFKTEVIKQRKEFTDMKAQSISDIDKKDELLNYITTLVSLHVMYHLKIEQILGQLWEMFLKHSNSKNGWEKEVQKIKEQLLQRLQHLPSITWYEFI